MPFCRSCGTEIRAGVTVCGPCETAGKYGIFAKAGAEGYSEKSYAVAIVLIWTFGLIGLHHFYLKNWLHGFFDFGLFVFGFGFVFFSQNPTLHNIGLTLIVIDIIHSIYITYQLIVGKCRDGDDLLLLYPGQKV